MRIHDSELSNLILRIEQDKKFLPIHDVINLGALRDLVDLRIESSAEITALRLETAKLNIDLLEVKKAHAADQETIQRLRSELEMYKGVRFELEEIP